MSYIQEAFNKICTDNQKANTHYVCLMESVPFYGGPEEGGWWGSDNILIAYKEYPTEELAYEAKEAVLKLAQELNDTEKKRYHQQCADQCDWLEQRSLDADYLPENDGPSEYYVTVEESIPQNRFGDRHYS